MKYRLQNERFDFVRGITLRTPGDVILDVRVGTSRVQQPLDWECPVYRLVREGEFATIEFERPDNWAHFAFDVVSERDVAPQGMLDLVPELTIDAVRDLLKTKRIAFLGCARNCGVALPASMAKLQELSSFFARAEIHVFENDSTDDTGTQLAALQAQGRVHAYREQGLDQRLPLRTPRLAYGRNVLLDAVLRDGLWDYVCWVDLDGLVGQRFSTEGFLSNFQLDSVWDAVFPLSWPLYYDLWALREPTLCATDFMWDNHHRFNAMLGDAAKIHAATQQLAPGRVKGWMPVQSAFGGFGLYKAAIARHGRYVGLRHGEEICEHVPYHEGLVSAGARLYLNPKCVTHIA